MGCNKKNKKRKQKNGHLANGKHPVTGVEFDSNGFPIFNARAEITLDPADFKKSNKIQFKRSNLKLYEQVKNSETFDPEELEDLKNGRNPENYTWHHHQDEGKMQLVITDPDHAGTGHFGGNSIWGNNSE